MVGSLLTHGRAGAETAALVLHGTTSAQQTITAPLSEIVARVQEREVTAPGVLVIGAVVGLRDHLRWFDKRPLFGRRVLVTRSREQAPELVELLELNGAEAIEAPVLRIGPPADPGPLERAAASARSFDWIVFTSTNAVASFVSRVVCRRAGSARPRWSTDLRCGPGHLIAPAQVRDQSRPRAGRSPVRRSRHGNGRRQPVEGRASAAADLRPDG